MHASEKRTTSVHSNDRPLCLCTSCGFRRDEKRNAFGPGKTVLKFAPDSQNNTCRSFHQIFRDFLVNRMCMGYMYLMRFRAFSEGKFVCLTMPGSDRNWKLINIWLQRRKESVGNNSKKEYGARENGVAS